MADTTTQDTPQAPEQETEAEVEQTPAEPTDTAEDAAQDDEGKGGKSAVLADLAKERDRRQAAETTAQETATRLDAVLTALGIKTDGGDKVDPEQLATDLQTQRAENAVLRAGHGIADVDALLDSRNFTDSLRDIDSSDRDAVKAHITEYVAANPRFAAATPQAHGVRDAAAGADTARLTGSPAQQFAKWSAENFD